MSGRIIGALNVLIDLTDQKADQARIGRDRHLVGRCHHQQDTDGKVTSWNTPRRAYSVMSPAK